MIVLMDFDVVWDRNVENNKIYIWNSEPIDFTIIFIFIYVCIYNNYA